MEYAIICAIFGLCFFIVPVWAYRKGLQDGLNVNQGKQPEPIKTPVAMVREYKQAKEEKQVNDRIAEGLENLLNYTGDSQEGGGK